MKTYEIPLENLNKFKAKIKAIQKKAVKLNLVGPEYNVVKEFEKKFTDDGRVWYETYVELAIESHEVKLSGWVFTATIDHRENGNILRANPKQKVELDLSKYHTAPSHCDHCSQQRKRNNTYLMSNESGELKQVGSSCIKDFIGHPSADYYAELYAYMMILEEGDEDKERSFRNGREAFDPKMVLEIAAMEIRLEGYRSAKMNCGTTSGAVGYHINSSKKDYLEAKQKEKSTPSEQDKKVAQDCIELAKSFTLEECKASVFKYNLKQLVSSEYIFGQDFGMLCYLPEMLLKTMEARMEKERQAKEAAKSNFVSEVGKRETFIVEHLKTIYLGESSFGYKTQSFYMYMFKLGNDILVWKTTGSLPEGSLSEGFSKFEVKGTVKAHNEYKGTKQTELTRCKVKTIIEAK